MAKIGRRRGHHTVFVDATASGGGGGATDTISANRIAEWMMTESSGQKLYNRAGSGTDDNLISVPEQCFNNYTQFFNLYAKDSSTVTDLTATNRFSEANKASRIVTSSGLGAPIPGLKISMILTAGTYTVSLYVKSNTGSTQQMRMEAPGGTLSSNMNVTTSWTQVSFTFTATGGTDVIKFVANDSSGNALDILIDGLKINAGSSATTYERPQWDILLGYHGGVESSFDPSYVTGGISMSSNFGTGMSATDTTTSAITCHAVVKLAKNQSKQAYLLMAPFNDAFFAFLGGQGGTGDGINISMKYNGANRAATCSKLGDNKVHHVCWTYDDSTGLFKYYIDKSLIAVSAVSPGALGSITINKVILSSNSLFGEYFNGEVYYASLYSVAHTQSQVNTQFSALQLILSGRSITVSGLDSFVLFDGDSISDVPANGIWPRLTLRLYDDGKFGLSQAIVGSTINGTPGLNARVTTGVNGIKTDDYYNASIAKNILVVFIGANDLAGGGTTAAAFVADLKTYCLARRAIGWKIVVCTVLPRDPDGTNGAACAAFLAKRNTANGLIVADNSFYDALARFDTVTGMGADGDEQNTTNYPDKTHPSAAGHALLAPVAKAAIDTI